MAVPTKPAKGLSDKRIISLLDVHISRAVGYLDSTLRLEREEVSRYLNMELPKKNTRGASTYVSQDVYDSVWSMHAQILETFSANRQLVKFFPEGGEDVQITEIQTAYAANVYHNQNPGYNISSGVIYDGLTSRVGVVKCWWEPKVETEERVFPEAITLEEVQALDASLGEDVVDIEAEGPDEEGLYVVTLTTQQDLGQVRIENVPPEEFLVSRKARCLKEAPFIGHRTKMSLRELKAEGYTQEKLDEIGSENWIDDYEEAQRFEDIDGGIDEVIDQDDEAEDQSVWVVEGYIRADLDGKGKRLWKILKAGKAILERERVKRSPFVLFSPLAVPHKLWGFNFAARVFPTATARTALRRSVIDHALVTSNPRFTVLNGSVPRPEELRDNRLGGIINVTKQDAVLPLQQAQLNPYVFDLDAAISSSNEQTTSISSLSQGLNKDAISKQNSADLVEQLTTNSQTRQKIVARNFAQFLIDLFILISDLVIENEKQERVVEVAGEYVPVDLAKWRRRADMQVDVCLGFGDAEREAMKWMMVHQMLSADPAMQSQYGPAQKYKVIRKILELRGVKDVDNYISPPEKAQPPQPDPIQMAELQLKQAQAAAAQAKAEADQARAQNELEVRRQELQLEAKKHEDEMVLKVRELELKERKQALDEEIAHREVAVVEKQADTEQLTAIASPNS